MSISTNKIDDVSDTNYSLLTNPTNQYLNEYSTQYDPSKNLIENFEKYRVLNLNKLEDVVEHMKHCNKEKIIKMLIETYKYYDLNIISTNIEDELIKLLNKINQKELFELFFDKLLDS